ncbi:anti-sigma factor [Streptomyces sp. CC224B]|uniref:anti-sigma factor n=1 Tax=Streptomyces sp. CC224B TaxID=3044571 RepID=UPI0024A8E858|nr:anti-sigma factor [Streptomyces sp. CC224B]
MPAPPVRADGDLADERAAAREIAHVLAASDARASSRRDARGRTTGVVATRARGRAVVSVTGPGRPPEGRADQLWVTRAGGAPRALGLLGGETPVSPVASLPAPAHSASLPKQMAAPRSPSPGRSSNSPWNQSDSESDRQPPWGEGESRHRDTRV